MHIIEIINEEPLYINIGIDGKTLRFSRKGNPDVVYSANMISDDLDHLLEAVASGQPLYEISFHLAGTNVIRMIDAFCLDAALQSWKDYAEEKITADSRVRTILFQYLGFTISSHLEGSPFCIEAKKIGENCKKEKVSLVYHDESYLDKSTGKALQTQKARVARRIQRQDVFDADGFHIEFLKKDTMHCVFLVNGIHVSLALSRISNTLTPKRLYEIIVETKRDLLANDFQRLEQLVINVGGRTVLCVMLSLYKAESIMFLKAVFRQSYQDRRIVPKPRKMLKSMFHCNLNNISGLDKFLDTLELLIPEAEQYLLTTNHTEIENNSDVWKLYHPCLGSVALYTIQFDFTDTLNQELREYFRAAAKSRIKSNVPITLFLYSKWAPLHIALSSLQPIGIQIDSIIDLRLVDCLDLQSYLAQKTTLAIKTQFDCLLELKLFYRFVASQYGLIEPDPFKYIRLPKKGSCKFTAPITQEALDAINERISHLPMCFQLAFYIAVQTGARAVSICSLTTNSLIKEDGNYYLIVYHTKTSIAHTVQNRPTTTKYTITADLAHNILKYIKETENLRSQLSEPFIFVYQKPTLRKGTKRKPIVLTHGSFSDRMNLLLKDVPLFHIDGTPVRCNFRSIRAELGRSMFANGSTPDDVAKMLGNTPQVAATYYNTMDAGKEAELYNQHYNAAFAVAREIIQTRHGQSSNVIPFPLNKSSKPVMYGNCESDDSEHCNKSNCSTCRERIVCRNNIQFKRETII